MGLLLSNCNTLRSVAHCVFTQHPEAEFYCRRECIFDIVVEFKMKIKTQQTVSANRKFLFSLLKFCIVTLIPS